MFVCFFDVQSCQIFCDSVDCSLPGFSVLRIFQARILEWIALSYSMDYLTILYVNYTSIKLKFQRRQWHPTPVLLPGKPHGQRSLVGCSPWGREESDTTERLHFQFSLSTFMHWRRKWQPTPVFLPGESQGRGSLVGFRLWGHTELDTTEAT